jgi:copper homeostasis protein
MKRDISFCKEMGCEGVVSGILSKDQTIDLKRTKEIVDLARPMTFTFHRAFDWVKNPLEELEKLKEMGVERILTSGQQSPAIEGIKLLNQLKGKAGQKLIILPGGGINRSNILQFKSAGFKEVHFSAVKLHKTNDRLKVSLNSDKLFSENQIVISDFNKIKEMVELVK